MSSDETKFDSLPAALLFRGFTLFNHRYCTVSKSFRVYFAMWGNAEAEVAEHGSRVNYKKGFQADVAYAHNYGFIIEARNTAD